MKKFLCLIIFDRVGYKGKQERLLVNWSHNMHTILPLAYE
jgi:hypothetical protein